MFYFLEYKTKDKYGPKSFYSKTKKLLKYRPKSFSLEYQAKEL